MPPRNVWTNVRSIWNRAGEPTLYLASDHAVLIAEFARHFEENWPAAIGREVAARQIFDLSLALHAVLDLRTPVVAEALSLRDAPSCFLNPDIARATAGFLRQTTPAQALIAPSMALLDQPRRWVMILFLEKLPRGLDDVVSLVEADGVFRLDR